MRRGCVPAQDNPDNFRDLTSTFTAILKTIVAQKLPKSYEYHGVSSPWYQIRLLNILALLGQDNQRSA